MERLKTTKYVPSVMLSSYMARLLITAIIILLDLTINDAFGAMYPSQRHKGTILSSRFQKKLISSSSCAKIRQITLFECLYYFTTIALNPLIFTFA